VGCRLPGQNRSGRATCFCGAEWAGAAMPSPSERQAEPTIRMALNGGYDLLEVKCNACQRVSLVALRAVDRPLKTPIWKLESSLFCERCSKPRWRQRAHILGLIFAKPDPEPGRQRKR
jgi:hypothetical protein